MPSLRGDALATSGVRRQLAFRLLRAGLLRVLHGPVAAAAHLVAGGGGAVLPALAARGDRRDGPGRASRRFAGWLVGVAFAADAGAVARRSLDRPALLRHRYACDAAAARCLIRGLVRPPAGGRRARPAAPAACCRSPGWPARPVSAGSSSTVSGQATRALPRRVRVAGGSSWCGDRGGGHGAARLFARLLLLAAAALHRADLLRALPLALADLLVAEPPAHPPLRCRPVRAAHRRDALVSIVSYQLIELPIREQRFRLPHPKITGPIAIAALVGLLIASTTPPAAAPKAPPSRREPITGAGRHLARQTGSRREHPGALRR